LAKGQQAGEAGSSNKVSKNKKLTLKAVVSSFLQSTWQTTGW